MGEDQVESIAERLREVNKDINTWDRVGVEPCIMKAALEEHEQLQDRYRELTGDYLELP